MDTYRSMEWRGDRINMLDQRKLPLELTYIDLFTYQEVADSIRDMVIRGAPAIGVAAAYGMALASREIKAEKADTLIKGLKKAAKVLKDARPTAVNLAWAVDRLMAPILKGELGDVKGIQDYLLEEAKAVENENRIMNTKMCENAMPLLPDKVTFIHHCNTGALATIDYGTALGVIRMAHEIGKEVFVYVDETRPRLQGGRLTSWELKELGIKHKVIADGASGFIMKYRDVDIVTVGCDRIAANGDVANKVGTYNLAVVARAHGIPCFSVGPTSTIDMATPCGDLIEIEQRPASEITHFRSEQITPDDIEVDNPAFDITPAEYLSGIITEGGIARPPFVQTIPQVIEAAKHIY